ncbi:hypothetical protein LCGC14_0570140 [marine sediment metagenome]|uniref:Uncharacterized protein n=1 Tax=marine sediment metagenome TaxID=412755 RepID=A0A0F9S371_9ZZZZ
MLERIYRIVEVASPFYDTCYIVEGRYQAETFWELAGGPFKTVEEAREHLEKCKIPETRKVVT